MSGDADGGTPRQARDVMAFGQEVGRVLSDGAVVGRAEPFAKVFASSRVVKRAVGLTAWGVLEDIALDAHLDAEGRLVAETSVRQIAANLGVNKETVARNLARLRDHGFVLHEEIRQQGSGRYETARYVLDPAACLERFTSTPAPADSPCTENPYTAATVSGFSVHGESVHGSLDIDVVVGEKEQRQAEQTFACELQRLGVGAETAAALASEHGDERVTEVIAAVERVRPRNPAGWAVAALSRGWQLSPSGSGSPSSSSPARRCPDALRPPDPAEAEAEAARAQRWQGWDAAVSAALDDDTLTAAVRLASRPAYSNRWVVPAVQVELIGWAAAVYARASGDDLSVALTTALEQRWCDPSPPTGDDLPTAPPSTSEAAAPLRSRLDALLPRLDPHRVTDADPPVSQPCPTPGGLP